MIDQQQYQVEKILAAKFCPKTNRVYYLVKWLNWDLTSSTWEPEQYLKNSIETLEEFKSNSKNNANPFNWKQYKEFTKFWREQDTQAKIPKNRGKKKKQPKQKIQKMNKKITKIKKFIKINSKEDESYEPQMQRQYTLSHQYRRCHSQKGSQKMSRRSEPIKTKRVKQEKIMLKTNQMIEKQKQKQKETMEKMLAKLPKNHILLVQTQKSQRKNEQSYQMCDQRQNIPQNLQKQEITQKITQKNSIQPKIQEKDNKYEVFSKKISELINSNAELISQVSNGIAKDVPSCKKNQQQEMQDQGRQMNQQGIKMNMNMKENQKQLQGQEADDEYSQISSNPRNLEAKNMRKTIIIYQNHQQSRPNRCQYKILGIKRESQNKTNVTNKEQLKYKVLNTETNEDYWQNKQFMLKNCAAQLIQFYQDNLDWKNKH